MAQTRVLDNMGESLAALRLLEKLINPDAALDREGRGELSWLLLRLLGDIHAGLELLEQGRDTDPPCTCRHARDRRG